MILAVLAIALCGAGVVAAGFPERAADGIDRWLRVALGAAFGMGAWSAAYSAARMLGWTQTGKDALLAGAGVALLFASRARPAGAPFPRVPAPRWLVGLLVAGCAVAGAAFVEHTWRFPDGGWDAWMVWNLRARFLVRAASLRTVFSPDLLFWAHADYPWLVPGAVAQGFVLAGRETAAVPEAIAAAFGILAVAVVALCLARLHGALWGVLAALAVVTVPAFPTFASNQQADIPLGVFVGASAALIALACAQRALPPRMLALAGFSAGLGAWTKNEGALYAVCLGAGLLYRTRDLRAFAVFCAGAAPAVAVLAGFKLAYAPPNDLAQFSTRATLIAHALDPARWGELAAHSLRRIVFFQAFGLWVVAGVVYAFAARKLPGTPVGTAVLLAVVSWVPLYLLQPHPLDWLFRTSVDRLILQVWPAAVLAMLLPLARTTART